MGMDSSQSCQGPDTLLSPSAESIAKMRISAINNAINRFVNGCSPEDVEFTSLSIEGIVVGVQGLWMHYESMGWLKGAPKSRIEIISERSLSGTVPEMCAAPTPNAPKALECCFSNLIKVNFIPPVEQSVCDVLGVSLESVMGKTLPNNGPGHKSLGDINLY